MTVSSSMITELVSQWGSLLSRLKKPPGPFAFFSLLLLDGDEGCVSADDEEAAEDEAVAAGALSVCGTIAARNHERLTPGLTGTVMVLREKVVALPLRSWVYSALQGDEWEIE